MRTAAHIVFGLVTSGLLVWILFRDVDWGTAGSAMSDIRWGWFALTQLPLWWVMALRVVRFRLIIGAVRPLSWRDAFSATQIGFFANLLLPARLGELVRPLALSRLARMPMGQAIAFATIDRLTDLACLVVCLVVAAFAIELPGSVEIPARTFGTARPIVFEPATLATGARWAAVMLTALCAVLAIAVASRGLTLRLLDWALQRRAPVLAASIAGFVDGFARTLGAVRNLPRMAGALLLAVSLWASFVACNAWYFEAFGLEYHWSMAFVLQALLMVSISVPGAPGFVGQFHLSIVLSLVIMSVDPDRAKALAILFHLINMAPVFVLGVVALILESRRLNALDLIRTSARLRGAPGDTAPV